MAKSTAATVEAYLAELAPERRETLSAVRAVILEHLPAGYVEVMRWGMITYEVPLETFPETYNKQPLMYCALAAQKRHCSLYLMGCYADPEGDGRLEAGFRAAGKRLDRGKGCVRFRTAGDLPLETIGAIVGSRSVDEFLDLYRSSRGMG